MSLSMSWQVCKEQFGSRLDSEPKWFLMMYFDVLQDFVLIFYGQSLLSSPEEPHMQDAFKTILPVSHLQPCVLALPQVKSPLILMPVCTFYRGTHINTIVTKPLWHMFDKLINFVDSISTKWCILKYFIRFFIFLQKNISEKKNCENFNISENDI